MTHKEPFYITTAIAYPNGEPHIGHAYEAISTDMLARYHRLCGRQVHFLTGIDDHGQKMVQTARQLSITPDALGNQMAARFYDMNQLFTISYDDFIRTKEPRHQRAAQALWRRIEQNGDIYMGTYKGWYAMRDEAFYSEEEITIQHGEPLAPTGAPVVWVEEESYFFRLGHYADRLLQLYTQKPSFLNPPERLNEIISFLKSGLTDLSISRPVSKLDWGIRVPGNDAHVMYVWVDALTNYISALGYPDVDNKLFATFWPHVLHVVGKDIVRFHAIIWPALLMAAGLEVPEKIFGHGFLLSRGEKMSKSVGNVISPFQLAKTYGVDVIRYFFLRDTVYGQDGNYSDEAIRGRLNADLANDLGNLVQRSLTMVQRSFEGIIPSGAAHLQEVDTQLLDEVRLNIPRLVDSCMQQCALHMAIRHIWEAISCINRYFAMQEPWKYKDVQNPRLSAILYATLEALRCIGIQLQPIMPTTASRLLTSLGVPQMERSFAHLPSPLEEGSLLGSFSSLFPRFDKINIT